MVIQTNQTSRNSRHPTAAFGTLALLLVVTFAFGGSARGDELGLLILRPVSALALLVGLFLLKMQHVKDHRFLIGWLTSIVVLTMLHLVPLPPSLWHQLPGRELAVEVDKLLGRSNAWRPISLSPELTRNALWSMMAPLACFLMMIQLSHREVIRVLILIIFLGIVSGVVSVLQISQGPQSVLYFYRVTNLGMGVGLFANRNHQALLLVCSIPIGFGLACFAVQSGKQWGRSAMRSMANWGIVLGAIFVFSLVVVTGSRAGFFLYFLALILTFLFARNHPILRAPHGKKFSQPSTNKITARAAKFGIIAFPVVVAMVVLLSGRAATLTRLIDSNANDESRLAIFDTLAAATQNFMPVGAGIGSFNPVFRGYESRDLLAPTYWNHAHNDWAEAAMTGGLPACLILAAGIIWLARHSVGLLDRGKSDSAPSLYSFIGGTVAALLAISSLVEYPLRVPSLSCLFMISIVLISRSKLHRHQIE